MQGYKTEKKVQSKEFLGRIVWLTTQEFKVQKFKPQKTKKTKKK
jgi:hypothetical protein